MKTIDLEELAQFIYELGWEQGEWDGGMFSNNSPTSAWEQNKAFVMRLLAKYKEIKRGLGT